MPSVYQLRSADILANISELTDDEPYLNDEPMQGYIERQLFATDIEPIYGYIKRRLPNDAKET